jgi:hypothetical protein
VIEKTKTKTNYDNISVEKSSINFYFESTRQGRNEDPGKNIENLDFEPIFHEFWELSTVVILKYTPLHHQEKIRHWAGVGHNLALWYIDIGSMDFQIFPVISDRI